VVRPLAIPAALIVIVGLPALVAQTRSSAQPSQPTPRAASLTVSLDGGGTHELAIIATGKPPTSAVLTSTDGRQVAIATAIPSCTGLVTRNTGVENGKTWCIKISGLPDHGTVSGTLPGTDESPTTLSLTVNTRDGLLGWPIAVLLIGLLASLVATPATKLLGTLIKRDRLALLLQRNQRADPESRIAGLDEYVAARKHAGAADATIEAEIAPVINEGPGQARGARQELERAISADPLDATSAYQRAAAAEAARTDNKVTDFLKPDGSRATHPAADLDAGLAAMRDYRIKLATAEHEISSSLRASCQQQPLTKLGVARMRWERVGSRSEIADLAEPFRQLRDTIDDRLNTPNCLAQNVAGASAAFMATVNPLATPGAPAPTGLTGASLVARTFLLALLTGVTVAAVLLFAFETVQLGAYRSKITFGSFGDYFTLFSTALASGAAATVAALLAPWSLTPLGKTRS
jgi:hypothetical protein